MNTLLNFGDLMISLEIFSLIATASFIARLLFSNTLDKNISNKNSSYEESLHGNNIPKKNLSNCKSSLANGLETVFDVGKVVFIQTDYLRCQRVS